MENETYVNIKNPRSNRKIYNASFIVYFGMLVLVALLRLLFYWGAFDWLPEAEEWGDFVWSFVTQILILGMIPVLIIALYMKKGAKGTLDYLQVKKPKAYHFLGFALGIAGYLSVIFIVNIWLMILGMFGYSYNPPPSVIDTFGKYALAVVLTAVLPGICEEITHRGLLLRAHKMTGASETKIVIMGGLFFGLFHMNTPQTLFTALMGCVMVYITLKSKSILPAVFMHFTNNFLSVTAGYIFDSVSVSQEVNIALNLLLFFGGLLCIPLVILLCWVFLRAARKAGDAPPPKPKPAPVYNPYAAYNPYAPRNPYAPPPQYNPYNPYQQQLPPPPQGEAPSAESPFPEYERPAPPQYNPYAPPGYNNPYAPPPQGFNPYAPPPPYNPYAPPGYNNPYAPPQHQNPFIPPPSQNPWNQPVPVPAQEPQPVGADVQNAGMNWQPVDNPDRLPDPDVFKPAAADNIFQWASIIFAGLITIVSFIMGL